MSIFVVDSNFFIQAHRVHYPLDVAVSFWGKVRQLANEGKIISIDKVKDELYDKNDALEVWCNANLADDFFKDTDEVMASYTRVAGWAVSKSAQYKPAALNEFLNANEADAFIIAFALHDNADRIIVTHEVAAPNAMKKIKIPDACDALDVSYVNTMEMFRQLGESF
jgi:hypothetical protein